MTKSKHAAKFKIGDWVAPRDMTGEEPDYDQGQIVDVRMYAVDVRWHRADEIHTEDPINLVRIARGV